MPTLIRQVKSGLPPRTVNVSGRFSARRGWLWGELEGCGQVRTVYAQGAQSTDLEGGVLQPLPLVREAFSGCSWAKSSRNAKAAASIGQHEHVFQHVSFLRRVLEYEAALLEHPPGTDVVVGHVGVQRPVEVDVEELAQSRGRVTVSPVSATDPEPDVALAFNLPAPDRADDSPASDYRPRDRRWVGLDLRLVLEERGQIARGERRHRARFRVGLELEQRAEVRIDRLAERELGHHDDALGTTAPGPLRPSVRWVRAPRTSPSFTPYRATLRRASP